MQEVKIKVIVDAEDALETIKKLNDELGDMETHLREIKELSDGLFVKE